MAARGFKPKMPGLFVGIILFSSLVIGMSVASATGPVTRDGANYSGSRNPNGCEIKPEGTDLHVKCLDGSGFIRYRFLRDVGGVRAPATVSAELAREGCDATVRWMAPIRTLRIEVRNYCHIRSVTWTQP